MFLYAFFLGIYFSYSFVSKYFPAMSDQLLIISLVIGILLALLAFFFIKFAIFIAGGIMGILLFNLIKTVFVSFFATLSGPFSFLIGLMLFLLFGALTLAFRKHLVIIFSALFGGFSLVSAAGIIIGLFLNPQIIPSLTLQNMSASFETISIFYQNPGWLMLIPSLVFGLAGIIAQYKFASAKSKK